ncbi:AFG1/ZapE family ATPase [Aliamphritea spongicola]
MPAHSTTFTQFYQTRNAQLGYQNDPAQQFATEHLQALADALLQPGRPRLFGHKSPTPKGLYMWGAVGRGKTYLLDLFTEYLPRAT